MHRQYVKVETTRGIRKLYNTNPEEFTVDFEELAAVLPNFDKNGEIPFELTLGCDDCQTDICIEVIVEHLPGEEELEPGESAKACMLKNIVYDVLDQIAEQEEGEFPDFAMLVNPDELAIFYALMNNDGPVH